MQLSLKSRILLIITIGFTLIYVVIVSLNYSNMKQGILNHRLEEAENIKNILMATRRVYHQQFLASGIPLTDKTLGFLPAHAMSRISKDFSNWSDSGMIFSNVSDKPRNPDNVADEVELQAMDYFRKNPTQKSKMQLISTDNGNNYYQYTIPVFTEVYCLKCHGNKEDAPPAIVTRYEDSYGYKLGDLRGLLSIKIPSDNIENSLLQNIFSLASIFVIAFIISLFFIYFLLDKLLLNQLNSLIDASKKVAKGNFDVNVPINNKGELSKVSLAFNSMTDALQEWKIEQDHLHEEAYRYQHQMQSIFDNTGSVIYMKDQEGRYLYINKMFERTFNLSNEMVKGKTDYDLLPKESADACCESDSNIIKQGETSEFIEEISQEDGLHTYISVKSPLRSMSGEIYGICGISTDITERLDSQQVLKERLEELEQFNLMAVGRELKMLALKKEINQLLIKQGLESKYKVDE